MPFTSSSVDFELSPLAPFRLDLTAWALRRRPENKVDRWDGDTYRRVICIQDEHVEISVCQRGRPDIPHLAVNVRGGRNVARVKPEIVAVLTRMLGFRVDLTPFYRMAARDPQLRELAQRYRGLKPVRFPTVFEALANAFACQQFTMAAGIQLLNRLANLGSVTMETPDGKMFGFPRPADLLRLSSGTFRRLGFSRQKARAFHDLSRGILARQFDFQTLTNWSNEEAMKFLLGLRGVGRWTAEYVLLRGLGRLDVFPGDDVGAQNRLAKWLHRRKPMDYAIVNRALRRWRPYAGFIYLHMLMESLRAAGRISA